MMMTNPQQQQQHKGGGGRHGRKWGLRVATGMIGVCIAGYIVGPPLYWHLADALASFGRSCPPCLCDCFSQPLLSISQELSNNSLTGCMKHDTGVSEEAERSFTDLLTEELRLKEAEASESQRRGDVALLEVKKMASQFQKEADKCNSGMATCEEARERAEAALEGQRKTTTTWELRARQRGWKETTSGSLEYLRIEK